MTARFYDGRSALSHEADVTLESGGLHIRTSDQDLVWRIEDLIADVEGDQVRVSSRRGRDARLILTVDEWGPLIGDRMAGRLRGRRRREVWLVGGLTAAAVAVVLFVFVGVPILSGPVARATPVDMEERMGENFDAQVGAIFPTCGNEEGQRILQALGDRIAAQADTPFDVRVRAVEAPMVNAFALPGGRVLITDDMIAEADGPDELAAVISHEVAHVEMRHVMQAVWRDLGIGMLLDLVVGGGTGAGQQAVILAGQASDLTYSREAELAADARGQVLLHAAGLSSLGMESFFERIARAEGAGRLSEAVEFMNSHPDSNRRSRVARAAARPGQSALTPAEWQTVKMVCAAPSDGPVDRLRGRFGFGDDATLPDQGDQMGPDRQAGRRP